MEDEKNIFLKYKYWFFLLLSVFIVFMFFYTKNAMGTFFDTPAMFLGMLSPGHSNSDLFLVFHDTRSRFFNNLLIAIPFNLIFIFFKNSSNLLNPIRIYSVSYFIIPFFLLICNYFVAKRTKRYDIAVTAFAFYFLFSIPNAVWAVRELHITILGYFLILSYFLSKSKLNLKDLIPIGFLILYLFESFETVMIFGLILFIFSYFYVSKKEDLNPWFKVLIGFGGLSAVIYTPVRMLIIKYTTGSLDFGSGIREWVEASKITLSFLFNGNLLIPLFALALIIILMFFKKTINWKFLYFGIPYLLIFLFVLYKKSHFLPDTNIELLNYSFALWLIFPIILTILFLDYFNIDVNKINPAFYSNLIIVTCIFGVINLLWQINTSFYFQKSNDYLKNLIKTTSGPIIIIPKEDIDKYNFLTTNTCYGQVHRSIILNNDPDNTKIIFPVKYYCDYSEYCFAGGKYNFYDVQNNNLHLQGEIFELKTKYWNLTKVADKFKESYEKNN